MMNRFILAALLILLVFSGTSCQDYNCSWERLAPHVKLTKPPGKGPFPAIVLLHGCGGMANSYPHRWDQRLADWGYVSLQVDSFNPRKISSVCAGGMVSLEILQYRVRDALLAKAYLSNLSFVIPDKIGLMGWSHGGSTVIDTVLTDKDHTPFGAAVAFYPWCFKPIDTGCPLFILSGSLDRWTPAEYCVRHASEGIKIEVYPGAYHCFDWEGIDTLQEGYILRHHPKAASDAYDKVRAFFDRYLGPKK
jgi:dienelactone hydrolase